MARMELGYLSEIFVSFQGEGPRVGERHLFVRCATCHLRCQYCDTPGSLLPTEECEIRSPCGGRRQRRNPLAAHEAAEEVRRLTEEVPDLQAIAVTGGEPLLQAPFLREWLAEAPLDVPVLLETSGTLPQQLLVVLPWVSVVSMDIKLPSNSGEGPLWAAHEEFLRACGRTAVYVKVPVDEGTPASEVATAAQMVARLRPETTFVLQPIIRNGRPETTAGMLGRFHEVARQHLADVRVVPQVHRLLGVA